MNNSCLKKDRKIIKKINHGFNHPHQVNQRFRHFPVAIYNFLNRYPLQWIKKHKLSAAVMLSSTCTKESSFFVRVPLYSAGELKSCVLTEVIKFLFTFHFYLVQVISETWTQGHFGYFFALEKVSRRTGTKARTN